MLEKYSYHSRHSNFLPPCVYPYTIFKKTKSCYKLAFWQSHICSFWTPDYWFSSSQSKRAINAERHYQHFSGCQTPTLSLFSKAVGRVVSSNAVIGIKRKVSDHKAQRIPWISEYAISLKYLSQLSALSGNVRLPNLAIQ